MQYAESPDIQVLHDAAQFEHWLPLITLIPAPQSGTHVDPDKYFPSGHERQTDVDWHDEHVDGHGKQFVKFE